MTTSSAQPNCSITSSDIQVIDLSDTITLDSLTIGATGSNSSSYYYSNTGSSTITLTGGGAGGTTFTTLNSGAGSTITFTGAGGASGGFIAQDISTIDPSAFTWKNPEEFVDCFPNFNRIQQMCETYPGLKIAYEKFVTTYRLVKDDYDNPNTKK